MSPVASQLIGREAELQRLRAAWSRGGSVQVVRGPAGIGKSRLVRELGNLAAARGAVVLGGRSTVRAVPLQPVHEALLGAARRGLRPPDELAPFVPALARAVPEWGRARSPGEASNLMLGEALLRFLSSMSAGPASLLVLEDVHWADAETLTVLDHLAANVAGSPVLVVLTRRDGARGPGAQLADDLVARRHAEELRLAPLGPDAVLTLARSCLGPGQDVPGEVVEPLVQRSEGVPFVVEELMAAAEVSGWDSVAAAVPGSIMASVEVRLDELSADARRLLAAAALLGRSFDWQVAAEAAALPEAGDAPALRQAVEHQLLDVDVARYRFRHALTRDAVAALTPPAERQRLARRALELVRAGPGGTETCLAAADLAGIAGLAGEAAGLLLQAARLAVASGALDSAGDFARRAAELVPGQEPARRAEIDHVRLEIAVQAGWTDQARQLARSLLAAPDGTAAKADVHLLAGRAELAAGRWDNARHHAQAARALAPVEVGQGARAAALLAQAAMGEDDVATATHHARLALESARATGQVEIQCEALEVLGRAARGRDVASAEQAFSEALRIASDHGLALWRVRALQELGTIDMFTDLELGHLTQARIEAEAMGAVAVLAVVDLQLAAVYDERGELGAALDAARRCESASRRYGLSTLTMSLVVQGMVHARRADRQEMDRVVTAAMATGEDPHYVEVGVFGNVVPIYHLVVGDLDAAGEALERSMAGIRRRPAAVVPVPGLWALVRTLTSEDRGAPARREVARLPFDTPVSRLTLEVAEAVARGRAGDAGAAAARFGAVDDELARWGSFRRWLHRVVVAPAAAADGWGQPEAWLRETVAWCDRAGLAVLGDRCRAVLRDIGSPVPRRNRSVATPLPPALARLGVTPREAEVLALVATGVTNREVAQRLVISVRTVDKHVERLLAKAGTDRRGLVALARETGAVRT